jgi:Rieske Fe-S protein
MSHEARINSRAVDRRSLVKMSLCSLCWAAVGHVPAAAQGDPASMPPQEDDVLVRAGDAALKPLTVADIPRDATFVSAWPMAPAAKVVRSNNRLNALVLVRLDPTAISADSVSNAVDGVLAFSALCTHAGCDVSTWIPAEALLSCDCHGSEFDVRAAGKVTVGPAARALPPLPLKLNGAVLTIAKPFATAIRFDEA